MCLSPSYNFAKRNFTLRSSRDCKKMYQWKSVLHKHFLPAARKDGCICLPHVSLSRILGFGIWNSAQGIQNSLNESGIWIPESKFHLQGNQIRNTQRGMLNLRLSWITLQGWIHRLKAPSQLKKEWPWDFAGYFNLMVPWSRESLVHRTLYLNPSSIWFCKLS